jgi:sodium-dependent dicarboxylate transporter 2/3/5
LALAWWLHRQAGTDGAIRTDAAAVAGLVAWMAVWWLTEAVELAVTALLPVILLPLLGIGTFAEVARHYADNVIFLFAGSCVLGSALERHGVSERFVRTLLRVAGERPVPVLAALLLASACISGFVSNMATTAMMLPLALAAAARCRSQPGVTAEGAARAGAHFASAAVLAVAYGSTIGGAATLIGSPPNMIAANWLQGQGHEIDFARWARVGVPIALTVVPLTLLVLSRLLPMHGVVIPPSRGERATPLSAAAWITSGVFAAAVACWSSQPLWPPAWRVPGLTDGGVAIAAAVALMILPGGGGRTGPVVPWSITRELPWGVLLLFGGGLALSDAMQRSGLASAIGASVGQWGTLHPALTTVMLVGTLCFASEIASNTALTATAIPILGPLAGSLGMTPRALAMATALAASYAFMLPVGTPPNALAYGTGRVTMRTMIRVGLLVDLISIAAIVFWMRLLA